jgi:hypothetical protein
MHSKLLPIFVLGALLSAGPSVACDPEEMLKELRAQCADALAASIALVDAVQSDLASGEHASVHARIDEAKALCNNDKYGEGFAVAAKLARFAGHVETRKGRAPAL